MDLFEPVHIKKPRLNFSHTEYVLNQCCYNFARRHWAYYSRSQDTDTDNATLKQTIEKLMASTEQAQLPTVSDDILADIPHCVARALEEDIGSGDITAQLIPQQQRASALVISRDQAVICGRPWVDEVFRQLDSATAKQTDEPLESTQIEWHINEGESVSPNQKLFTLHGNTRVLLTGERAALNFLQTLSATATTARQYADISLNSANSQIKILDTRKTIPGLRLAQKYAAAVGGCQNHRIGLYDAFLIKENHIAACGGIGQAIAKAREIAADKLVEVEVETLAELHQALAAKADVVMLDNFSPADIEALSSIDLGETKIEVSGDITEEKINAYSHGAVDFISSGSITKHIRAVDLSMRLVD
jgi:nicotinate-nucleotide pyrophosphorylase (carboxylating)